MLEIKIIAFSFIIVLILAFLKSFKQSLNLFKLFDKNLVLSIAEEKAFRDFLLICSDSRKKYRFILNEINFYYEPDELVFYADGTQTSIAEVKKHFIKHLRSNQTLENIKMEINKLDNSILNYETMEKEIINEYLKTKEGGK